MYTYEYKGRRRTVRTPEGAEVSGIFGPRGILAPLIQAAIDAVKPWSRKEQVIETFDLPRTIGARAVRLHDGEVPVWAVNPHHRGENPGPSPYVLLGRNDERWRVGCATIEISGPPESPMLLRAYPGEYTPPIPTAQSARRALGGREACIKYWREHAYVIIGPEQLSYTNPPDWYVEAENSDNPAA